MRKRNIEWWKNIFDERYLKTYSDFITKERTNREVKFIERIIKNKIIKNRYKIKKFKILDLACGYGRHSLNLAQMGYEVLGIDYSKKFLVIAKKEAKRLKLKNVKFLKKDMRKITFKNEFDLVINMFTSFGYFENENDNLKVLKNIYDSLKVGGYFILDLENPAYFINLLITKGKIDNGYLSYSFVNNLSSGTSVKTILIFDHFKLRGIIKREWFENNKKFEYEGYFKLYYLDEITTILKFLRFHIIDVYGDFSGKKFSFLSPRMIILSRK